LFHHFGVGYEGHGRDASGEMKMLLVLKKLNLYEFATTALVTGIVGVFKLLKKKFSLFQ